MNHNEVLGVKSNATTGEIQQAFRKAALEHHPDHSNSPEAAEAFARIKQARDELMKRAATVQETESVQQSTTAAVKATANAAFATAPVVDDLFDGFTPDEIVYIQNLDRLANQKPKRAFFGRSKESTELKKHRKKLATNNRRLQGLY